MGPPEPSLSFTIPSLHDDLPIDCRIYHPHALDSGEQKNWTNTAVILAHPYGPLGGCQDVPVVLAVTRTLLKEGVTVGTFNFRGAGGSKGKTTWTGKGEIGDYEAVAGFLAFYLDSLDLKPTPSGEEPAETHSTDISAVHHDLPTKHKKTQVQLVLGGYSYGSLVVTRLPAISEILAKFSNPKEYSTTAEIISCAVSLAAETNRDLAKHRRSHSRDYSLRVGGECASDIRRSSREIRRNGNLVQGSLDIPSVMESIRRNSNERAVVESGLETGSALASDLPTAEVYYLLISPLLPPVSSLIMLPVGQRRPDSEWNKHPTFAIFGDQDGFTSFRKLSQWSQKVAGSTGSKFRYVAVTGAGHFWIEQGVESKLKDAIRQWTRTQVLG